MDRCFVISKTTNRLMFEGTEKECEDYLKLVFLAKNMVVVNAELYNRWELGDVPF